MTVLIPVFVLLLAAPPDVPPAEPTDIRSLEPFYLDNPDVEMAYRSFKRGNLKDARKRLTTIIGKHPDADVVRTARWLLVATLESRKATRRSKQWWSTLRELQNDPVLAGPVHLRLAEYAKSRGDSRNALAHYRKVPDDGAGALTARLATAQLLLSRRRPQEALVAIERAERTSLSRYGRNRLRLLEADALIQLRQRDEAVELLWSVWDEAPSSAHGKAAAKALARLKSRPAAAHHVVHAFASIQKGTEKSLKLRLRKTQRAHRRAGKDATAFARGVIASVSKKTRKTAIRHLKKAARSRRGYVAGHAMLRLAEVWADLDEPERAMALYEKMARAHPSHPSAGDALASAAILARRLNQPKRAERLLKWLGRRYQRHPKQVDYLWRAAWETWRGSRYRAAARQFAQLAAHHGTRRHLGQATWFERATYWQARSEHAAGRKDTAIALWARLVEDYPLSYYSHQSFNRLVEVAPERTDSLRPFRPLDAYDPSSGAELGTLQIDASTRDVRLAAFLTRCGLFEDAIDELEARARSGRLSPDGMSLLVALGVRMGRVKPARAVVRFRGVWPRYPDAGHSRLWKLAYPLPFWETIQAAAERFKVSPWLVIALIRHESRYNPGARSRARAIGLMQLLVGTARNVARRRAPELGRITRRALTKPAVNIPLGTAFLEGLSNLFKGNSALMLAAYNAGPGRARRWWREAQAEGRSRTDELVEEIPYKETHSYVKSVLASYGVYRYLYGDRTDQTFRTVPLARDLPDALGDFYSRATP